MAASPMEAQAELIPLLETLYASRNPTRRWLHCTRRDWIIAQIGEAARGGARSALEVGFGAGVYLPALAANFTEVTATDLDEAHLEHAQATAARTPKLHLMRDNILATRLPAASFDVIVCSEVIEHIPDTAAVLAALRRCAAPGGRLILSTPQRYSLLELACKVAFLPGVIDIVRRIYGEAVFETGHINLMTAREAEAAITAAGFTIRERFKSGMYIPLVAEFTGTRGLGLAQGLERRLRGGALDWMLWTQYYVAEAS